MTLSILQDEWDGVQLRKNYVFVDEIYMSYTILTPMTSGFETWAFKYAIFMFFQFRSFLCNILE